jgi:phosphohistidine phosphatase
MKTLYLMRHAKSSQNMFGVADIDRPLLTEGIEDSRRMAFHLMDLDIKIKHIVTSPAKRALATAEIVAHAFG